MPSANPSPERRPFGLASATAVVVASMIGTGVFTTSGFTLADLHSPARVLLAWAIGGVVAALGALTYGALARRLPESGGEYLFLSRTLHPGAGYVAGWISFFAGFSAPLAAAAMAFGSYSKGAWPGIDPRITASVLLVLAAVVHAVSTQRGMWLHNAAVALKLLIIAVFIGVAFSRLPPPPPAPPDAGPFPWAAFAVSLVWISFSYSGWNAAIYIGGEVRDAERTLPRALLLGTALVTALYLLLNAVFVFAAPAGELAGRLEVGLIAATALGGPTFGQTVSVLISLVLVAHVSGMTLAGPRVSARMAADGCLPRVLAPAEGPPRVAILAQTTVALLLLWAARYDQLLTYIGFTLGLSTAATVAGLVRLRWREGTALRVIGWPWAPFLFLAVTLWTTIFSIARRPLESCWGLGVIAAGALAWYWTGRRASARR